MLFCSSSGARTIPYGVGVVLFEFGFRTPPSLGVVFSSLWARTIPCGVVVVLFEFWVPSNPPTGVICSVFGVQKGPVWVLFCSSSGTRTIPYRVNVVLFEFKVSTTPCVGLVLFEYGCRTIPYVEAVVQVIVRGRTSPSKAGVLLIKLPQHLGEQQFYSVKKLWLELVGNGRFGWRCSETVSRHVVAAVPLLRLIVDSAWISFLGDGDLLWSVVVVGGSWLVCGSRLVDVDCGQKCLVGLGGDWWFVGGGSGSS